MLLMTFSVVMLTSIIQILNMGQTPWDRSLGCSETVQARHSAETFVQWGFASTAMIIAL